MSYSLFYGTEILKPVAHTSRNGCFLVALRMSLKTNLNNFYEYFFRCKFWEHVYKQIASSTLRPRQPLPFRHMRSLVHDYMKTVSMPHISGNAYIGAIWDSNRYSVNTCFFFVPFAWCNWGIIEINIDKNKCARHFLLNSNHWMPAKEALSYIYACAKGVCLAKLVSMDMIIVSMYTEREQPSESWKQMVWPRENHTFGGVGNVALTLVAGSNRYTMQSQGGCVRRALRQTTEGGKSRNVQIVFWTRCVLNELICRFGARRNTKLPRVIKLRKSFLFYLTVLFSGADLVFSGSVLIFRIFVLLSTSLVRA